MGAPVSIGWAVFLSPSVPGLVLGTAFLAYAAWRLGACAPSLRERVLATAVWGAALVVAYAQVLSLVGQLHWPGALALAAAGAFVAHRRAQPATTRLRDEVRRLEAVDLAVADDPLARQSAIEAEVEATVPRSRAGKGGTRTYRGKSQKRLR